MNQLSLWPYCVLSPLSSRTPCTLFLGTFFPLLSSSCRSKPSPLKLGSSLAGSWETLGGGEQVSPGPSAGGLRQRDTPSHCRLRPGTLWVWGRLRL